MGSLRFRLSAGLAAQACSWAVTIGIQLISVPILIGAWGLESYGVWLIASAIPSYLALADLGFAQVGASDMTMRVARGDRDGARATFHTVFAMNCLLGLAGLAVMGAIAFSPAGAALVGEAHFTSGIRAALVLLSFHVLLILVQGVVGAGMRAEGAFALMAVTFAGMRFLDAAAVLAVALAGGDIPDAALAMLGLRLVATLLVVLLVRRRWHWLTPGFAGASKAEMRRMLGPSLHYTGYSLGNLASLQGSTIVIGAVLGPAAVALASTARTLARLGLAGATMLNLALQPEYSTRFGHRNRGAVERLFTFHIAAVLLAAAVYLALMLPLGPQIYAWWTKNAVALPPMLFGLLVVATAADMLWTALQTPAISANHMRLTGSCYLLASLAGLGVLFFLLPREGVVLFGWVSLAVSALMVVAALFEKRRLKQVFGAGPAEAALLLPD